MGQSIKPTVCNLISYTIVALRNKIVRQKWPPPPGVSPGHKKPDITRAGATWRKADLHDKAREMHPRRPDAPSGCHLSCGEIGASLQGTCAWGSSIPGDKGKQCRRMSCAGTAVTGKARAATSWQQCQRWGSQKRCAPQGCKQSRWIFSCPETGPDKTGGLRCLGNETAHNYSVTNTGRHDNHRQNCSCGRNRILCPQA